MDFTEMFPIYPTDFIIIQIRMKLFSFPQI